MQQVVDSKFVEVRNVAAGCALLGEMSHLEKVAMSEQLGDQILALLNGFDVLQGFCLLGSLAKVDMAAKTAPSLTYNFIRTPSFTMELPWRFRAKAWEGAFAKLHQSRKRIEGL